MSDELRTFGLDTLSAMGDGTLRADFDSVLAGLVRDCLERPTVTKKRQVSVVIDVVPVLSPSGGCDDVEVRVQVASKQPARALEPHVMHATVKGGLRFNPHSPADPDQRTMFDDGK